MHDFFHFSFQSVVSSYLKTSEGQQINIIMPILFYGWIISIIKNSVTHKKTTQQIREKQGLSIHNF